MSEPMTSHLQECIYCGEEIVPSVKGHICDEHDWMQHTENLHSRIAALKAELARANGALVKIADWHGAWGPYPETNPQWAAMAVMAAREIAQEQGR